MKILIHDGSGSEQGSLTIIGNNTIRIKDKLGGVFTLELTDKEKDMLRAWLGK